MNVLTSGRIQPRFWSLEFLQTGDGRPGNQPSASQPSGLLSIQPTSNYPPCDLRSVELTGTHPLLLLDLLLRSRQ